MLIVRAQTGVSRGGGGGPAATAQTSTIRFGSRSFGPGVSTTARNTTRDHTTAGVELDLACVAERHGEEGESVGDSVSRMGYAMHPSAEVSRDQDLDKV